METRAWPTYDGLVNPDYEPGQGGVRFAIIASERRRSGGLVRVTPGA